MEKHLSLTDQEFEEQFSSCKMNSEVFSHEAHLRLAWIHINKYGFHTALQNISQQLKAFVEHAGAKDKYNKTLTLAAVNAVNHFVRKSKATNFETFIIEFPSLKNNFKGLIKSHYSVDIFNSTIAKKEFLEPDLLPFD